MNGDKVSYHELKKRELITGRSKPENLVKVMSDMANSALGSQGVVKHEDGHVWYEQFKVLEDTHGVSYLKTPADKIARSAVTATGYTHHKIEFNKLGRILADDCAYCSFEFKDGIRGNDHIISSATFIVLDIDDSEETYQELHDILGDFKHHIAKTSNDDNPYKFRVLLPSDIEIDISPHEYKHLIVKIGEYLGITVDALPKSQIFYGWNGREVLTNTDGDMLPVSELIKHLDVQAPQPVTRLTPAKVTEAYSERLDLFRYAYDYQGETGAAMLFRAFKHSSDLGFDKEMVIALIEDICDYRDQDVEYIYQRSGLLRQIERHFKEE